MTGIELRTKRQKAGLSQAKFAELAGLSQHLLSAVELGKIPLSASVMEKTLCSLADTGAVSSLVSRSKRYRSHSYYEVAEETTRTLTPDITPGNAEYRQVLQEVWRNHARPERRELSALSVFSGCGGFSLGISAAGFAVKGCLEKDDTIKSIYKANFPNTLDLGRDICRMDSSRLRIDTGHLGAIDLIVGGPPCQGFSLAGKRDMDDPRNLLFKHYMRVIAILQPRIAVLENVQLLTSMRNSDGGRMVDEIASGFSLAGYNVKHFKINAKHYGVPQHRERLFFIACRSDLAWTPEFPIALCSDRPSMFGLETACRTFGDACSDLAPLESGEAAPGDPLHRAVRHPAHGIDWLRDVPQGKSAHENADPQRRPPSSYNTTYKRQVWDEPASTVQTTFGMISGCRNVHPYATRSLTMREAARIQSFPDEFIFRGNAGTIRTGIGNAVPPLLAYRLGLFLKQQLQRL